MRFSYLAIYLFIYLTLYLCQNNKIAPKGISCTRVLSTLNIENSTEHIYDTQLQLQKQKTVLTKHENQ